MKRPKQHIAPSVQSPEIITPRKVRHRKVAQAVIEGKSYTEIAQIVSPNVKYPRQTMYGTVQQPGVQEEIRKQAAQLDFTEDDIREVVARRITRLKSSDDELRPGDAKVVEIGARIKAMLTDKQIVENVTSADTLIERAEEALSKLKHDTQSTSDSIEREQVNVKHGPEHGQGENAPTPSGNGVEATPAGESEKD